MFQPWRRHVYPQLNEAGLGCPDPRIGLRNAPLERPAEICGKLCDYGYPPCGHSDTCAAGAAASPRWPIPPFIRSAGNDNRRTLSWQVKGGSTVFVRIGNCRAGWQVVEFEEWGRSE